MIYSWCSPVQPGHPGSSVPTPTTNLSCPENPSPTQVRPSLPFRPLITTAQVLVLLLHQAFTHSTPLLCMVFASLFSPLHWSFKVLFKLLSTRNLPGPPLSTMTWDSEQGHHCLITYHHSELLDPNLLAIQPHNFHMSAVLPPPTSARRSFHKHDLKTSRVQTALLSFPFKAQCADHLPSNFIPNTLCQEPPYWSLGQTLPEIQHFCS